MTPLRRVTSERAGSERGFTIIELLIAITVLVVGVLALAMTLNTSRKLTLVSERQTAMVHQSRVEADRLKSLSYSALAMVAAPSSSADPNNPDSLIAAGPPPTMHPTPGASSSEQLAVDAAAGTVSATPVAWSDGRLSGLIYEFVSWHDDTGNCGAGCPATKNFKRITVAVTVTGGSPKRPVYYSTFVADPSAAPAGGTLNGNQNPLANPSVLCQSGTQTVACTNGMGAGSSSTYYLYDTPATQSTPQIPLVDHVTHPTIAIVGGLLCTIVTLTGCPVPDLMGAAPPPTQTPLPPLLNYSTEHAGGGSGGTPGSQFPGGRVVNRASDCSHPPSSDNSTGEMWVSSPVSTNTTFSGDGGLSLFTQTLASVAATVNFCIQIYDVANSVANLIATPPTALGGASYASSNWPQTLTSLAFIFNFRGAAGPVTIAANHRIGIRIWIAATSTADIAAVYSHPLYQSQIQLNTQ